MLGRAAVLASLLLLLPSAAAAPNATHIVVGQTTDLSAHNAEFGRSSRAGLQAAFSEANAAGVLPRPVGGKSLFFSIIFFIPLISTMLLVAGQTSPSLPGS